MPRSGSVGRGLMAWSSLDRGAFRVTRNGLLPLADRCRGRRGQPPVVPGARNGTLPRVRTSLARPRSWRARTRDPPLPLLGGYRRRTAFIGAPPALPSQRYRTVLCLLGESLQAGADPRDDAARRASPTTGSCRGVAFPARLAPRRRRPPRTWSAYRVAPPPRDSRHAAAGRTSRCPRERRFPRAPPGLVSAGQVARRRHAPRRSPARRAALDRLDGRRARPGQTAPRGPPSWRMNGQECQIFAGPATRPVGTAS